MQYNSPSLSVSTHQHEIDRLSILSALLLTISVEICYQIRTPHYESINNDMFSPWLIYDVEACKENSCILGWKWEQVFGEEHILKNTVTDHIHFTQRFGDADLVLQACI